MSYSSGTHKHEKRDEERRSRKLFIGGVSFSTNDEDFFKYFAKYGELEDCVLIREKDTGQSRGFGFVTYKDKKVSDHVATQQLYLDGRRLDPKPSISRYNMDQIHEHRNQTTKVFVGGLHDDTAEAELSEHFTKFGQVLEVNIMYDRFTNAPRGFGFVTFKDGDVADKVINYQQDHIIHGKKVDCKPATARKDAFKKHPDDSQSQSQSQSHSKPTSREERWRKYHGDAEASSIHTHPSSAHHQHHHAQHSSYSRDSRHPSHHTQSPYNHPHSSYPDHKRYDDPYSHHSSYAHHPPPSHHTAPPTHHPHSTYPPPSYGYPPSTTTTGTTPAATSTTSTSTTHSSYGHQSTTNAPPNHYQYPPHNPHYPPPASSTSDPSKSSTAATSAATGTAPVAYDYSRYDSYYRQDPRYAAHYPPPQPAASSSTSTTTNTSTTVAATGATTASGTSANSTTTAAAATATSGQSQAGYDYSRYGAHSYPYHYDPNAAAAATSTGQATSAPRYDYYSQYATGGGTKASGAKSGATAAPVNGSTSTNPTTLAAPTKVSNNAQQTGVPSRYGASRGSAATNSAQTARYSAY